MVIHVSGADWFRAKQRIDDLVLDHACRSYRVVRASVADPEWFETVGPLAKNISLFSGLYCVVLTLDRAKGRAKDAEDQEPSSETLERVKEIVQLFLDSPHALVVWNRGAKSVFPSKSKKIETQDFPELKGGACATWAMGFAKSRGLSLPKAAATSLVEANGNDTARIAQEIEKLALSGSAAQHHVLSYSPVASYFDWMQDLLEGRWRARAQIVRLDEHEAAQRMAGLINALRIVLIARSPNSVERSQFMAQTNRYWTNSLTRWAGGIETEKLGRWFGALVRLDVLVRNRRMSEPEALEWFAFDMMH